MSSSARATQGRRPESRHEHHRERGCDARLSRRRRRRPARLHPGDGARSMLTVEGDGAGLTVATRAVWAKSRIDERGELTAWLPLHEHLADAADAAELL